MSGAKKAGIRSLGHQFGENGRAKPSQYLVSKSRFLQKDQRALLVADGEGRNSVWCAGMGLTVDAFDISPQAIEKAKQLSLDKGVSVTYTVASCDDWDWVPEKYDVVIVVCANFTTPCMRVRLFDNCVTTLKPGGILILNGYSMKQLGVLMLEGYTPEQLDYRQNGFSIREHFYSEDLLRKTFTNLEILEIVSYTERERKENGSVSVAALMGMMARKRHSSSDAAV
ncbi:class I SAM-dependent methyltransferase [Oxalobacter paraformigenes]|uniref:Methyltransferase domain-containing protein n=1 Tax=Oxalobacter paraformigenes TaxID=556268 RepID=C3X2J9_9BURK|nr:class I SAM-dependent methyltransferase [Oxalobacter paraformigenes]EEO27435.1 hypothetical protein OFAG_00588 [Oxalobacter paraformigenes]